MTAEERKMLFTLCADMKHVRETMASSLAALQGEIHAQHGEMDALRAKLSEQDRVFAQARTGLTVLIAVGSVSLGVMIAILTSRGAIIEGIRGMLGVK